MSIRLGAAVVFWIVLVGVFLVLYREQNTTTGKTLFQHHHQRKRRNPVDDADHHQLVGKESHDEWSVSAGVDNIRPLQEELGVDTQRGQGEEERPKRDGNASRQDIIYEYSLIAHQVLVDMCAWCSTSYSYPYIEKWIHIPRPLMVLVYVLA